MVLMYSSISSQSLSRPGPYAAVSPANPPVLPMSLTPLTEPTLKAFCGLPTLKPALARPRKSMRSAATGGVLFALTIAPTPPATPRVLSSKS